MSSPEEHRSGGLICLAGAALLAFVALPATAQVTSDASGAAGREESFDLTLPAAASSGEVESVRVVYSLWGTEAVAPGADLVLVHGWASDRFAFGRVMDGLESRALLTGKHRVLALDLPGHGSSERLPEDVPYSQSLFASAVIGLMDEVDSRRAIVLGHSNGTPIARLVASRDDRVVGLIAVDGQVVPVATAEMLEPMISRLSAEPSATAEALVRSMVSTVPDAIPEELTQQLVAMAGRVDARALIETLESSVAAESWPEGPVEVPLLLVLAAQPTWDDTYRQKVSQVASEATWVIWQKSTHFLQLQDPVRFARTLSGWLSGPSWTRP